MLGVPAAHGRPAVLLVQPGGREPPHRRQHAEPVGLTTVNQQPGGIDQAPDGVGERWPVTSADSGGVGGRERAGEDTQRRQQPLLLGPEQVVAAAHDVHERAAAGVGHAVRLGREQGRPLIDDLAQRQGADPAGDQLDRQRQAVQPAAQLGDDPGRDVGAGEAGQPLLRPGHEQPDGIRRRDIADGRGRGGTRHRRHRPAQLARDAQHRPAGHHDAQPWHRAEQPADQRPDLLAQVLGAVQDEQARGRRQRRLDRGEHFHPRLVTQPEGETPPPG